MQRRHILTVGTAVMASMALAACAAGGSGGGGGGGGGGAGSDGGGGELTFVSWGGGYQEAQQEHIVDPWAEENGVNVLYDGPTDYAKLSAQVESGNVQWDVITLEPFWAIQHCGTMLEEIVSEVDTSKLPEEAVSDCAIPFDILSYFPVYNTETYADNPPTSWADFFDTENFPGKRGIWNYAPGMALEAALLADGVAPEDLYPLDVERAFAKLDTIRDDIVFYDTGAQQVQQIESGEVAMTIAWSGRALEAARNGAPYEPIWKDHIMLVDSLSVLKGAPNRDLAIDLINYAVSAEPQARFMEAYTYGSVNSDARPELDELAQQFSPTELDHYEQGFFMDAEWWAENYDRLSEEWTKWSAG